MLKISHTFGRAMCFGVLLAALLLGASVPGVTAAGRHSVTVMTQNLYQGTELANTLAANNQQQFVLGVANDSNNVVVTNLPHRADAIASEIERSEPSLVGLQEVAVWQTFPVDATGKPAGPPTVTYDFEKILLDKLAAHFEPGGSYAVIRTAAETGRNLTREPLWSCATSSAEVNPSDFQAVSRSSHS